MKAQVKVRITQAVGSVIGLIGIYMAATSIPLLYSAIVGNVWELLLLFVPWLVIGLVLVITGYRAIFRHKDTDNKSLAAIAALVVMLLVGDILEPVLAQVKSVRSPKQLNHLSSALSFVCAIVTYQVLKRMTTRRKQPNQAL